MNRPLIRIPLAAAALLICCGDTSGGCNSSNNNSFRIGPSGGQIAGVAVGVGAVVVGTVVLVHVHNTHHNLKGCVLATAGGVEVKSSDGKLYHLTGDVSKIHEGDLVDLHGDKLKKTKDATGDQVFQVSNLKKDHGPCKVIP